MANNQITPFQLTDQFTMDNFNQRIEEINTALDNIDAYTKAQTLSDATKSQYGLNSDAIPDNVFERLSHFTPTGAVFWLASETIPEGFLLCDGSSVSRTQYPALFAVIGTTFGSDDDETFKLPDLRAAFIRGAGTSGSHNATFSQIQEASALGSLNSDVNVTYSDGVIGTEIARNSTMTLANPVTINQKSVRPYNMALTPIIKYY